MTRKGWDVPRVPGQRRAELEGLGSNLAEQFYKRYIDDLRPIPADDFFDVKLGAYFDVIAGLDGDLPPYIEGLMIPVGRDGRPEVLLNPDVYGECDATAFYGSLHPECKPVDPRNGHSHD